MDLDPLAKELSLELTKTQIELDDTKEKLVATTEILEEYIEDDNKFRETIEELKEELEVKEAVIEDLKEQIVIKTFKEKLIDFFRL